MAGTELSVAAVIRRVTVTVFVCAILISALVFYHLFRDSAVRHVEEEARVLLASAMAVRAYTVEQITPRLAALDGDAFIAETVPSYAAQSVFRRVAEQHGGYVYREAALNPTNPDDRATPFETELILRFRADAALTELSGVRPAGRGQEFYLAKPIRIEDAACLSCHSTPDRAPPAMVARYGTANGFGWALGEVIGIQFLTAPLTDKMESVVEQVALILLMLGALFGVVYVAAVIPLQQHVIRPLRRLAETTERASLCDAREDLPRAGAAEIARLSLAVDRLRESLRLAVRERRGD